MKIEIYQDQHGFAVVRVEGEPDDSPEAVAKAYLEVQKILKEAENK